VFSGDDGFGVHVVHALARESLPEGVRLRDFGTRGHDLALALSRGTDVAILVDASPRGRPSGAVSVLELELPRPDPRAPANLAVDSIDPVAVLQLAANFGAQLDRLCLVGGEPAVGDDPAGRTELSPVLRAALPGAVATIKELLAGIFADPPRPAAATDDAAMEESIHEYR